jgi:uncharacterized protein
MTRALITGASSGLGLEFAWQLAATGHDLVLIGKDESRIGAVAQQLRHVFSVAAEPVVADLAAREDIEATARRLRDPVSPIDMLVTTSISGPRASFLGTDPEEVEAYVDGVVLATTALSRAAAGAMIERRRGCVLNVSSLAALTASGLSAATRSYVTVFTQGLAAELHDSGVTATVLLPGYIHTEDHGGAAVNLDGLPRITWPNAPFIVRRALEDAARGEVVSVPWLTDAEEKRSHSGLVRRAVRGDLAEEIDKLLRQSRVHRAQRLKGLERLRHSWRRRGL